MKPSLPVIAGLALSATLASADLTFQSGQHEQLVNTTVDGSVLVHNSGPDQTTVSINNTVIAHNLDLDGRSVVNASNASIHRNVFLDDNARATLDNSWVDSWIEASGDSDFRLRGTDVTGGMKLFGDSSGLVRETSVTGQIHTFDTSTLALVVDIDDVRALSANDESLIIIEGLEFNHGFGDIEATSGTLSGTWVSGKTFSFDFSRDSSATIRLVGVGQVPAPSASALLGLGALGALRRRRREAQNSQR